MFSVSLTGAGLTGADRILVPPETTKNYELVYRGSSVLITNAGAATLK